MQWCCAGAGCGHSAPSCACAGVLLPNEWLRSSTSSQLSRAAFISDENVPRMNGRGRVNDRDRLQRNAFGCGQLAVHSEYALSTVPRDPATRTCAVLGLGHWRNQVLAVGSAGGVRGASRATRTCDRCCRAAASLQQRRPCGRAAWQRRCGSTRQWHSAASQQS